MILFNEKMKIYTIIVGILALADGLIYVFTSFKSYSLGFFVGLVFSYVNLWTIYRKTIIVGQAASNSRHPSILSLILAGFGFVIRAAIAVTAIWLAIQNPGKLNLFSVIIGFSLIYIIILVDMISQSIRKR